MARAPPGFVEDDAVQHGLIVQVGRFAGGGVEEIDASGLVGTYLDAREELPLTGATPGTFIRGPQRV
ncbi:hypothetical protein [Qipengyuania sediminis]|uniref:hypothetical protein n=1 Tax=Qipengyuania sediminis TaxID=1532023 RepID=UPI0010593390|nr:hypothetical protein [Qipengyuania sediminis]